jgi:hypothetical protein
VAIDRPKSKVKITADTMTRCVMGQSPQSQKKPTTANVSAKANHSLSNIVKVVRWVKGAGEDDNNGSDNEPNA